MPPTDGSTAPDFTALLCTGETFRSRTLSDVLAPEGGVLVWTGFAFSAIAENWWKRLARADWDSFDVPVVGVGSDGPYAQNAFLREIDVPFRIFADVNGEIAAEYDLVVDREGMAGVRTARRAVFVLDGDRTVVDHWVADDWISPIPQENLEAAIGDL